jgi:hypothetical protein
VPLGFATIIVGRSILLQRHGREVIHGSGEFTVTRAKKMPPTELLHWQGRRGNRSEPNGVCLTNIQQRESNCSRW